MREDPFVEEAFHVARATLEDGFAIRRGAALLYEVTVNNRLQLAVDPKAPMRGQSAFQTDLCIFETVSSDVAIPRVVLEFKTSISTHDVLTYSTKARKHKQVYPYLRYGLVIGNAATIPGRFFKHNEGMDFCVAALLYKGDRVQDLFGPIIREEIATSRKLEQVVFGKEPIAAYRADLRFEQA